MDFSSRFIRAQSRLLLQKGIANVGKIEIPVWFRGHKVGDFEADLLVENCVLLELKAVRQLDSAHQAQLLNYLRNRPRGRLAVELWNQTPVQKDVFRQFSEEKGPTVRLTRGPTYAKPGRNRVASCRSQILFISVHPRLIISCHGFGLLR